MLTVHSCAAKRAWCSAAFALEWECGVVMAAGVGWVVAGWVMVKMAEAEAMVVVGLEEEAMAVVVMEVVGLGVAGWVVAG